MLDSLNDLLGPHIFPAKEDGSDPARLPVLRQRPAVAEAWQVRRLHRLLELSRMPLHPHAVDRGDRRSAPKATRPGVKVLGEDPKTGEEITLRDGRFGAYVQEGGRRESRSAPPCPRASSRTSVTLEKAIALLSLPREVAKHPEIGEPIVAGIGRYGSYVQHKKTYANLGQGRRRAGNRRQSRHRS